MQDCPNNYLKRNEQANISRESEIILIGSEDHIAVRDIWIVDSGATSHMMCQDQEMLDCKKPNQQVMVEDGRSVQVVTTGKLKLTVQSSNGEKVRSCLTKSSMFLKSKPF